MDIDGLLEDTHAYYTMWNGRHFIYKSQKYRDIGRLEPNYVPNEFYIAVTYRDIFAIRGTHA